jgi:CheY-like chemotaxis protein
MRDEDDAIRKIVAPILREKGYFVRTAVRLDDIYQKMKTEEVLSSKEMKLKHPFHPDIDIFFWNKECSFGEPPLLAAEVKYFRMKAGKVYPSIYQGLDEALMLMTFGFNYVILLHLLDPEIPSDVRQQYKTIMTDIARPDMLGINYCTWTLDQTISALPKEQNAEKLSTLGTISEMLSTIKKNELFNSLTAPASSNPLMHTEYGQTIRSIMKKYYRIISK